MRAAVMSSLQADALPVHQLALALALGCALTNPAQAQQMVRAGDLIASIEAALAEKGMDLDSEVSLAAPDAEIPVSAGAPAFEGVSYNPLSGRFVIRTAGGSIVGFARDPIDIPVLVDDVARGDIIAAENIVWMTVADAGEAVITGEESLIGHAARRPLQAGKPLRKSDVAAPTLVKRGALIAMTYDAPGLSLTHAVVAEANGVKGEVIEVKNPKSERIIEAVVTGPGTVAAVSQLAGRQ